MPLTLPDTIAARMSLKWADLEPHYKQLTTVELSASNIESWLADWSRLNEIVYEQNNRLAVATSVNTADEVAEKKYKENIDSTFTFFRPYEQQLKEKLLASGIVPAGMEIPVRNLRAEADLYRESNLPLIAEEQKLNNEYDKLIGAQTVMWNGEERTFMEMYKILVEENDRSIREKSWITMRERILADKPAIHELWRKLFAIRQQIAANAGKPDYRSYVWGQKLRFDYTPEDCKTFHAAIESVVVPAAGRVRARRRAQMKIDSVRPWDEYVDPLGRPALRPFETVNQLIEGAARSFDHVDTALGHHFRTMMEEDLLDLDNRKNRAGGAYCTFFDYERKPFIFMSVVGVHYDFQTLLHEGGHAFHCFEAARLPYTMQLNTPMEFNEVASMSMELLAAPTLADSGLYTLAQAARARVEALEDILLFWPYMALVDMFQHWIYENPNEGADPERVDSKWSELFPRFLPDLDYRGIEKYLPLRWHRQGHITQSPFYYIEYGLAQLGAVQVWANALKDQSAAVASYRRALALGATVTLPELFATAGAKFAFDESTLKGAVDLIEEQIQELERMA